MSENIEFDVQKDILLDLAKSGMLSHTIIIECENIVAAYDFFMNIVKAKMCVGADKPCGKCSNCVKIASSSHPDIMVTKATGKNKSIRIEDIRKIREDAYIISNEGSGKFYIIENADVMTVQAQNALIKILEEPPKNVIFVLICMSCGNLLSTIRSRAHIFRIKSSLKSEEDEISLHAKQIVIASLEGRSDQVLEYVASFGADRKKFKTLIEYIIENFIEHFKSENFDSKVADNLALKLCKLRDLANLVNKNVNMNLLISVACSYL